MRGEEPGSGEISQEAIGIPEFLRRLARPLLQASNPTLPCAFASVDTDVSIASTTHLLSASTAYTPPFFTQSQYYIKMVINPHKLGVHKVLQHIPLNKVFDAPAKARLAKAVNIADLRLCAKQRAHKVSFNFVLVDLRVLVCPDLGQFMCFVCACAGFLQ